MVDIIAWRVNIRPDSISARLHCQQTHIGGGNGMVCTISRPLTWHGGVFMRDASQFANQFQLVWRKQTDAHDTGETMVSIHTN